MKSSLSTFTLALWLPAVIGLLTGCSTPLTPLERQAKAGDVAAMYQVGIAKPVTDTDNRYLRQAAEAGHLDAQFELGKRLYQNPWTGGTYISHFTNVDTGETSVLTDKDIKAQNLATGIEWLKKAAAKGHAGAIAMLKQVQ